MIAFAWALAHVTGYITRQDIENSC